MAKTKTTLKPKTRVSRKQDSYAKVAGTLSNKTSIIPGVGSERGRTLRALAKQNTSLGKHIATQAKQAIVSLGAQRTASRAIETEQAAQQLKNTSQSITQDQLNQILNVMYNKTQTGTDPQGGSTSGIND